MHIASVRNENIVQKLFIGLDVLLAVIYGNLEIKMLAVSQTLKIDNVSYIRRS